jgi:hypothetical protein
MKPSPQPGEISSGGRANHRMQICVCGWYYTPELYQSLLSVCRRFDLVVVAHRPGETLGLPSIVRENTGLDWGAFSHFLRQAWEGEADVLFLHDDTAVHGDFWDDVLAIEHDQAFIFRDESEYEAAYSHGRAHFASARFLRLVQTAGGIWFDEGNRGFIAAGPSWSENPPPGCMDHNAGIRAYTEQAKSIGMAHPNLSVNQPVYSTNISLGRRGALSTRSG